MKKLTVATFHKWTAKSIGCPVGSCHTSVPSRRLAPGQTPTTNPAPSLPSNHVKLILTNAVSDNEYEGWRGLPSFGITNSVTIGTA